MKRTLFALTLILALALSACGTDAAPENTSTSALNTDYENALPVQLQLSVGAFNLEGTELAVDATQAADLIPLWQVLNGLNESGAAAPEEIDALVAQIEETMTAEQIKSIAAMQLTRENMGEIMQEYALSMGNGETPPEGMVPGQGRGGSGVPGLSGGGSGRSGDTGMTPEQIATAQAERDKTGEAGSMMNSRISRVIVDALIELLQSK
ncbi:MAG: hypothetical protein B5M51_03760 [Anaerolinea sp. 4484_236]|nr:MAG: hypothetical protein B5M51_03760 [Anaerolinea sp. 4484_236]